MRVFVSALQRGRNGSNNVISMIVSVWFNEQIQAVQKEGRMKVNALLKRKDDLDLEKWKHAENPGKSILRGSKKRANSRLKTNDPCFR